MCVCVCVCVHTDRHMCCLSSAAHTFDGPVQNRINDRINVLIHVTEETGEAKLDGNLQVLQEVRVIESAHLQWWGGVGRG